MKTSFLNNYNRFVLLIWGMLWLVMWMQHSQGATVTEAGILSLLIILIAYPFSTYLSTHLLRKALKRQAYQLFVLQFISISALIAFLLSFVFKVFIYLEDTGIFPPSEVFAHQQPLWFDIIVTTLTTMLINFGFCGLRFFEENIKLQKSLTDSQLQILQAQINPHFMFNVLNHIHILMQKDVDTASALLIKYSDILRYQLYTGQKETTNLEQEIQFLKKFIDIEKTRWKDKITVNCSWEIENSHLEFPPLLLITFIENAFKHVSRSATEIGYIHLQLRQKGNSIELEVENSKSAFQDSPKQASGLGLENIRKRLDILLPDKYSLIIKENEKIYHLHLSLTI